jgi:hypothetical protein
MKKCANCGFECSDEAVSCPSCSTDTFVSSSPEALGHIISPEEQHFWEQMTFRQFAVFIIRVQGVWLLFDTIAFVTYLSSYWSHLHDIFVGSTAYSTERAAFFWALFRVIYHIAAGILCIQYADRIVSWFVKDIIPKPPTKSDDHKPAA